MLASVFVALWVSTELLAAALDFPAALGSWLFSIGSVKIYAPHKYWAWIISLINTYGMENPQVTQYLYLGVLAQLAAFFIPAAILKAQLKGAKARSLIEKMQGSARWAEREDIVESSLLPQQRKNSAGVYVGAWEDPKTKKLHYLRHNGLEHILAYAPTRSGKGVGLVLPTLLSWPESVIVLDVKGENYALTSGWRKSKGNNNILKFDPLDQTGTCARYNPLNEIRIETEHEHADIENLAMLLADPDGTAARGNQKHWIDTATSLLVAVLYHLLYMAKYGKVTGFDPNGKPTKRSTPYEPTLEALRFMFASSDGRNFKEDLLKEIITYPHRPKGKDGKGNTVWETHPIAASNANEAYQRPENEAGSVLSTAANALKLFADPAIAHNTSNATFRLEDLTMLDNPTSLYVCIPPAQLNRLVPLVRILITQIVTVLASKLKNVNGRMERENKKRLLLMLDEFPTLGNMEVFETALAFIAGYGLKAYIIVQDLTQLYKRYTDKESIVSNTHVQVAYAPNKIETAKLLSEILGNTTVIKENKTKSISKGVATYSTSEQEVQRALLTPNEVMGLKGPLKNKDGLIEEPGDMIIKVSGFPPILGRQILYFKDPVFDERSKIAQSEKSDILFSKFSEKDATPVEEENPKKETTAGASGGSSTITQDEENGEKEIPEGVAPEEGEENREINKKIDEENIKLLESLKNPYQETIDELSSDSTSFECVLPLKSGVYEDYKTFDELSKGDGAEKFDGDVPEEAKEDISEIEMDKSATEFYSSQIEKNDNYFWEEEEETLSEDEDNYIEETTKSA